MSSIACPHCSQPIVNDPELAGKVVACPHCNGRLQMPGAARAVPAEPAPAPQSNDPLAFLNEPSAPSPQRYSDPTDYLNSGGGGGGNPYQSPTSYSPYGGGQGRYRQPHRGGMILTFGILGLVICGIFAIVAWVMGSGDLREMRAGRMDSSGQGATQAGMILGIIGCVFMALGVLYVLAVLGTIGRRF